MLWVRTPVHFGASFSPVMRYKPMLPWDIGCQPSVSSELFESVSSSIASSSNVSAMAVHMWSSYVASDESVTVSSQVQIMHGSGWSGAHCPSSGWAKHGKSTKAGLGPKTGRVMPPFGLGGRVGGSHNRPAPYTSLMGFRGVFSSGEGPLHLRRPGR
jgi:hypothetical protein